MLVIFLFAIASASAGDASDISIASELYDNNLKAGESNEILSDNIMTFKQLEKSINVSSDTFKLEHDYEFDDEHDNGSIVINKCDFTINGNNHVLNGNGQCGIFNITGNNVTINNLIFRGGFSSNGGAIYSNGNITLNNVFFIDNAAENGGAINTNGSIVCNGCRFVDNNANEGSSIYSQNAKINVFDTYVTSSKSNKFSQIYATNSTLSIYNVDFENISSTFSPALYCEDTEVLITDSRFVNLTGNLTSGAIAVKSTGNFYMMRCKFINTISYKNAGAIHVDYGMEEYNATITDCVFENTSSMFGGALIQLGGNLLLNNSNFTNSKTTYNGGAVYLSFTDSQINNCIFDSNRVESSIERFSYGGAIYCDYSNLNLTNSKFINNSATLGNAIYAYDSDYNIINCLFKDNLNAIYTVFDKDSCDLNNNEYTGDSVITNKTCYYGAFSDSPALDLIFINNTINVSSLPSKFDLRDWGWVTSVKNQGNMNACWAFAFVDSLESSLVKSTGIEFNISQNNFQNFQLRYSQHGTLISDEGGVEYVAVGNCLNWYGIVHEVEDKYDEVGKLCFYLDNENKVRLQDAYFIMPNSTDYISEVKKAILNYGAVTVSYYASFEEPYFNESASAYYNNKSIQSDHSNSIVGWDDNYSADNFLITPPGDGAWIVKNTWGSDWGEDGYFYLSYYEKSFFIADSDTNVTYPFVVCIFNNDIDYHVNYQTDLVGLYTFDGNYTQYSNEFTAQYDDLIASVGTYFNESNISYSFDIYVNGKLVHTQKGVSEFAGYRTIILDKYIPIKRNDVFKVVFKSNSLPYEARSRQHYIQGMSFVSVDGTSWKDFTLENKTVCLKVYTMADDSKIINNKDVSVDYNGGKYFSVKIVTADGRTVGAGANVKFIINGKTTTVKTDSNGIAKIKIVNVPGKYTVKTIYNGKTYSNKVTVKQVLTSSKVTVKKTAKKFTLKAKLKINGKLMKGKWIKFKFNGKTYKAKTNAKGIAQKILNKKVIQKLKKGKTYTVKVTYLKDTIKTTVKVK